MSKTTFRHKKTFGENINKKKRINTFLFRLNEGSHSKPSRANHDNYHRRFRMTTLMYHQRSNKEMCYLIISCT